MPLILPNLSLRRISRVRRANATGLVHLLPVDAIVCWSCFLCFYFCPQRRPRPSPPPAALATAKELTATECSPARECLSARYACTSMYTRADQYHLSRDWEKPISPRVPCALRLCTATVSTMYVHRRLWMAGSRCHHTPSSSKRSFASTPSRRVATHSPCRTNDIPR